MSHWDVFLADLDYLELGDLSLYCFLVLEQMDCVKVLSFGFVVVREHQQFLVRAVWILKWHILSIKPAHLGKKLIGPVHGTSLLIVMNHLLELSNVAYFDVVFEIFKVFFK